MITEQSIREAYVHLRTTNTSIPDETLDFMLEASLEKLKEKEIEEEKPQEMDDRYWIPRKYPKGSTDKIFMQDLYDIELENWEVKYKIR